LRLHELPKLRFSGLACVLAGVVLQACAPEKPDPQSAPRELLQHYLEMVDENRYERARELSTPAERARLREVETLLAGEPADSSLLNTEILDMNCITGRDTAICRCLLQDQYAEAYVQYFRMLKLRQAWYMDAPLSEWEIEQFDRRLSTENPQTESYE
jgi:hypothetical protein